MATNPFTQYQNNIYHFVKKTKNNKKTKQNKKKNKNKNKNKKNKKQKKKQKKKNHQNRDLLSLHHLRMKMIIPFYVFAGGDNWKEGLSAIPCTYKYRLRVSQFNTYFASKQQRIAKDWYHLWNHLPFVSSQISWSYQITLSILFITITHECFSLKNILKKVIKISLIFIFCQKNI